MKKFILTIFVAMLFLNNGIGQMVDVTVATVSGTSGQIALVPVTASGIDESNGGTPIVGLNIDVVYNPALVTFIGITDYNAILTAVGSWNGSAVDNGIVHVDYQTTNIEVPVSMPDGQVLYNLNFIANAGGSASLTLSNIEFNDVLGNLIPTTLTNGSITFGAPLANATWNGTGVWYTPANWSPGLPGKSTVTTIATGIVTIDATTAYTGNASINAGAGVTINTGRTLYVNGNLTLESNAGMTATGSLLRNGNLTVIGTTISKRYMTGGVQHFISIPVSSAKISDLISPGNTGYFFKYNEPGNIWENPWDPNYTLVPSVGYSVNYTNTETIEVTGISNNDGTYTAPVSRTSGNGWNLVGNTFPIGLDWNNASGWTKTNIDNAIYIWNNAAYASYVAGVGANGGTQYIPQCQGFFVHSSTGTPTLAIKKAARTHTANGTNFMKEEVANVFRLAISNGSLGEETVVYLNSEATESFDTEYDAYKLFGFNAEAPHIYTRTNETDYAINGQPMVESVSLPVLVKTTQSGVFTFNASGFETFDGYYFFILEDKENGINYDLVKNSEIVLNLNAGETNDRFTLRIFKSALGIGDDVSASTRIYAENKSVYIENCPKGQVNIYNMAGMNVSSNMLAESSLNMISLNVPAGIYVVKMTTQNGSISSKVFIK